LPQRKRAFASEEEGFRTVMTGSVASEKRAFMCTVMTGGVTSEEEGFCTVMTGGVASEEGFDTRGICETDAPGL